MDSANPTPVASTEVSMKRRRSDSMAHSKKDKASFQSQSLDTQFKNRKEPQVQKESVLPNSGNELSVISVTVSDELEEGFGSIN